MYGMNDTEYRNYIVKRFKTDRKIIDDYKKIIIEKEGYVFLTDYIAKFIPQQVVRIECNNADIIYKFLSPVIETINKILSIEQAFYELTCEAKLMPVNLNYINNYINSSINLQFITRSSNMTSTQTDKIEFPVLPNLQYLRVN